MTDNYIKVRFGTSEIGRRGDGLIEDLVLQEIDEDGVVLAAPSNRSD